MGSTIDLTTEEIDRLTTLPSEVIQLIIGYLFPMHDPNKALSGSPRPRPRPDLLSLAVTCRKLHEEVQDWAHHFLHQHRDITKYKTRKTAAARSKQRPLHSILHWSSTKCVFCGKKTVCTALLMNGLNCCNACDRAQWPDKITKTNARLEYGLRDDQLLPSIHGICGSNLPAPRYGTFMCSDVMTTIFPRKDVERLATAVYGDAHWHQKQVAERRKIREEKREAKKASEAAKATITIDD